MIKRTLSLSLALSEQMDKKARKASERKTIRLGTHDFPAGPVSPVDIIVGRFIVGDMRFLGIPFEPTGRILHGDIAEQDGLGHGGGKIHRGKQTRPVTTENRFKEGIVVSEGIQFRWLYVGKLFLGKQYGGTPVS